MASFVWSSAHAVFVDEVDTEHRSIFDCCCELQKALLNGSPRQRVIALVDHVVQEITEHFAHEEKLMRASRYSGYAWHKRQHQGAARKAKALQARVQEADVEAALELLHYLSAWLNGHTGLADRMMGAHIRNQHRERASKAS